MFNTAAHDVLHAIARERKGSHQLVGAFLEQRMREEPCFASWWERVRSTCAQPWFYGCMSEEELDSAELFLLTHCERGQFIGYFSHGEPGKVTIMYNAINVDWPRRVCCQNGKELDEIRGRLLLPCNGVPRGEMTKHQANVNP